MIMREPLSVSKSLKTVGYSIKSSRKSLKVKKASKYQTWPKTNWAKVEHDFCKARHSDQYREKQAKGQLDHYSSVIKRFSFTCWSAL